MKDDLVTRLRRWEGDGHPHGLLHREAADRIEKLRMQLVALPHRRRPARACVSAGVLAEALAVMAYAAKTDVPLDQSIAEIVKVLRKAGADRLAQAEEPGRIAVQCFLNYRLLRFAIGLPDGAQSRRQRGRALLLVIKAKIESIESGVETFDEAFLANIVTPDGRTIAQWAVPQIDQAYVDGKMPTQLMLADQSG